MSFLWFSVLFIYVQGVPFTPDDENDINYSPYLKENEGVLLWKGSKILYKLLDVTRNNDDIIRTTQNIESAMEYLKYFTCLEFEKIENPTSVDHLLFLIGKNDTAQKECWCHAPTKVTRQIGVGSSCDKGQITYLIIRALGIIDEHRRTDRNDYVKLIPKNSYLNQEEFDSIVSSTQQNNTPYLFPYDYESITHLSAKRFSRDGLPTIEPLQEKITFQEEFNRNLSIIDVVKLNAAFGCFNTMPEKFSPKKMNLKLDGKDYRD